MSCMDGGEEQREIEALEALAAKNALLEEVRPLPVGTWAGLTSAVIKYCHMVRGVVYCRFQMFSEAGGSSMTLIKSNLSSPPSIREASGRNTSSGSSINTPITFASRVTG